MRENWLTLYFSAHCWSNSVSLKNVIHYITLIINIFSIKTFKQLQMVHSSTHCTFCKYQETWHTFLMVSACKQGTRIRFMVLWLPWIFSQIFSYSSQSVKPKSNVVVRNWGCGVITFSFVSCEKANSNLLIYCSHLKIGDPLCTLGYHGLTWKVLHCVNVVLLFIF